MITGIDPASMSQQELPIIEACVSARSMVSMGLFAIYASPNGLVMASGSSARLITEGIITKPRMERNDAIQHPRLPASRQVRFLLVHRQQQQGRRHLRPVAPEDGFIRISGY